MSLVVPRWYRKNLWLYVRLVAALVLSVFVYELATHGFAYTLTTANLQWYLKLIGEFAGLSALISLVRKD